MGSRGDEALANREDVGEGYQSEQRKSQSQQQQSLGKPAIMNQPVQLSQPPFAHQMQFPPGQYSHGRYLGEHVASPSHDQPFTLAQQPWSLLQQGSYSPQQQYFFPIGAHGYPQNPYPGGYGPQPMSPQFFHPDAAATPGGDYQIQYQRGRGFEPPTFQSNATNFPRDSGSGLRASRSSVTRGPPRRPRQSGHALWVGNLPPGSKIIELKDHFSQGATDDIESLKLMSKTNCAFVNYRTEEACEAAARRFDGSYFQSARLTCRMRKASTSEGSPLGEPSNPVSPPRSPVVTDEPTENSLDDAPETPVLESTLPPPSERGPNRYFVLKSLTTRDLEVSTQIGTWATQPHNEVNLNDAFELLLQVAVLDERLAQLYKTADNVYLIFSANKTGEYFGLARMCSAIPAPGVQSSTLSSATSESDGVGEAGAPRTIYTPATEWAPEGRIVDDMARGLIFWEAQSAEERQKPRAAGQPQPQHPPEDEERQKPSGKPVIADGSSLALRQSGFSKPNAASGTNTMRGSLSKAFQVEWISTRKVRFHRLRGLRNPWNGGREIKVARDGTELEPGVGKRLVEEFFLAAS